MPLSNSALSGQEVVPSIFLVYMRSFWRRQTSPVPDIYQWPEDLTGLKVNLRLPNSFAINGASHVSLAVVIPEWGGVDARKVEMHGFRPTRAFVWVSDVRMKLSQRV